MMNWVFHCIKKILNFMYYSYFVFFEGVFKTSKSWKTIDSVVALMSLNIGFPIIHNLCVKMEHIMNIKFSKNIYIFICLIIFIILYRLLYIYYKPIHKYLEKNYKTDPLLKKILHGCLVPIMFYFSLYFVFLKDVG